MKKIKAMLVTEHKILGDLIRTSLTGYPELSIEAEYEDGKEAYNGALRLQPELVLTGIDLPSMDGILLTKKLLEFSPETKTFAVTHYPEKDKLLPFLEAGGRGYLSKYTSDKDLLTTVESVLKGDISLSKEGFQLVAEEYRRLKMASMSVGNPETIVPDSLPENWINSLSSREKQVLQLYAHGYSNKEICQILFLSTNTVETYKKRVKQKLQLTNKAELMQYAKRHGLLEDWED